MPSYLTAVNGSRISRAYAEAMASAPITRTMLATYEFRHPNFTDDNGDPIAIRIVNDFTDLDATIETGAPLDANAEVTFTACPVSASGPEEGDTSTVPTIALTVDGVSGHIIEHLDQALLSADPIEVTERIYASDDTGAPARLPVITMILRSIQVGDVSVTANATFFDLTNTAFPKKEYTEAEHPGLAQ